MSSSKKLPPHPFLTAETITYNFVWETCFDEAPRPPTPPSHIRITHLTTPLPPESSPTTPPSQTSTLSSPPSPPSTPKTLTITDAHANGNEYIPCTALLTWRHHTATFHGQFNTHLSKFSDWLLDERETNKAFLDAFGEADVGITHTPRSGFRGGIGGTEVRDDAGELMLGVWVDGGVGWGVKLWGKMGGGLSLGERGRLGIRGEA